jgi:hypothetical protein
LNDQRRRPFTQRRVTAQKIKAVFHVAV